MDDKVRTWILDIHNELRNNVAIGNDTRGGNGKAANMMALVRRDFRFCMVKIFAYLFVVSLTAKKWNL